jgi:hypothetical protein
VATEIAPAARAPDGSGSLLVALDLRTHQAVVEHSGGPVKLAVVAAVGGAVQINQVPQEVRGWSCWIRTTSTPATTPIGSVTISPPPGGARPRGLPGAVPRPVDTGQCVVGDVRPGGRLSPAGARSDDALGEYILNWDDVRAAPDPPAAALDFARSAFRPAESRGVQTAG